MRLFTQNSSIFTSPRRNVICGIHIFTYTYIHIYIHIYIYIHAYIHIHTYIHTYTCTYTCTYTYTYIHTYTYITRIRIQRVWDSSHKPHNAPAKHPATHTPQQKYAHTCVPPPQDGAPRDAVPVNCGIRASNRYMLHQRICKRIMTNIKRTSVKRNRLSINGQGGIVQGGIMVYRVTWNG